MSLDQWGPGKNSNTKAGSIISTSVLIVIAIIRFPFNGFLQVLEAYGFLAPYGLLVDVTVLFGMLVVVRVFAYLALKLTTKR